MLGDRSPKMGELKMGQPDLIMTFQKTFKIRGIIYMG